MRKVFNGEETGERIDGTRRSDEINGNGGSDELIGHPGDDEIHGGDGRDRIWGGQDHDTLWGDAGNDQFRFNSLEAKDSDTIMDFQRGKDKIGLDIRIYTDLAGGLTDENVVFGSKALDADDHVLYDADTGRLFYDSNGDGAGGRVLLATLEDNPDLGFGSFFIFGFD